MAGKVLSIGGQPKQIQSQQPEQAEGWGQFASRNLQTGLVNLIKNLEAPGKAILHQTPEMIKSLEKLGAPNYIQDLHKSSLSNVVQQGLGLTEEQMQPKSLGESFIQKFIPNVATAALGAGISGSPIAPAVQAATAGAALSTGAKALDLGPKAEALADIAGGTGWNIWKSGGFPGQLRRKLRPEMESAYKKARVEGSKIQAKVPEYEKHLEDEIKILTEGNPGISRTDALKAANELNGRLRQIQQGKMTPAKLMDQKEHFYSLYKDLKKTDPKLAKIYYRAGGAGTSELNKIAEAHPEFGKDYSLGTDLYKGLDAQGAIRGMLEKNTKWENIIKNPKLKLALLGGAGLYAGKPAVLLGAASVPATFLARYANRTYDLFSKSKAARKLALDLGVNAIKNNKAAFLNNLKALEKEASKQDHKQAIKGKVLKIGK